jgi:hypothetical protein
MKRTYTLLISSLGILLATGCNESPGPSKIERFILNVADTSALASISGNIVNADSLPVSGSRVLVHLVGPVPPDSTPPDSVPPDTLPPDTTGLSRIAYDLPTTMFRDDSIPGDSTPPPPPPPTRCGDRGQLVARTRSDRNGNFQVVGLAAGIYDIRVEAGGQRGAVCGVIIRAGQQLFISVMVTRSPAS